MINSLEEGCKEFIDHVSERKKVRSWTEIRSEYAQLLLHLIWGCAVAFSLDLRMPSSIDNKFEVAELHLFSIRLRYSNFINKMLRIYNFVWPKDAHLVLYWIYACLLPIWRKVRTKTKFFYILTFVLFHVSFNKFNITSILKKYYFEKGRLKNNFIRTIYNKGQ